MGSHKNGDINQPKLEYFFGDLSWEKNEFFPSDEDDISAASHDGWLGWGWVSHLGTTGNGPNWLIKTVHSNE